MSIPSFITSINGIDDAMVDGKPRLCELVPELLDHCRGAVVVAHNAAFDRRFLPFLAAHPSACSWRLAAKVVPEAPNHKNQTLRTFFGVVTIPNCTAAARYRRTRRRIVYAPRLLPLHRPLSRPGLRRPHRSAVRFSAAEVSARYAGVSHTSAAGSGRVRLFGIGSPQRLRVPPLNAARKTGSRSAN